MGFTISLHPLKNIFLFGGRVIRYSCLVLINSGFIVTVGALQSSRSTGLHIQSLWQVATTILAVWSPGLQSLISYPPGGFHQIGATCRDVKTQANTPKLKIKKLANLKNL